MFHDYGVPARFTDTSQNRTIPLRPLLAEAEAHLAAGGVASPAVDARHLLAFVLDLPLTRLTAVTAVTPEHATRLRELVASRARRVPLQHLTGRAPFRYLDLAVGPGVFVPRPETEALVSWGLDALGGASGAVVVDLCSGSGAIALAVAHEHPGARVFAVERDPAALSWLRRNADGSGVTVVEGDATARDTLPDLDGRVALVLCNPPYVPAGTAVPAEVAEHDPAVAVFGGPDGLDVIRGVVARSAALLAPGGALGIEHDDAHATAVPDLLRRTGRFDRIEDHDDLAGRPRFATGRRLAD
jgi:release factor glutamine methyltransferase